jgi:hypothetical protein
MSEFIMAEAAPSALALPVAEIEAAHQLVSRRIDPATAVGLSHQSQYLLADLRVGDLRSFEQS